jgi:hypothetical protein
MKKILIATLLLAPVMSFAQTASTTATSTSTGVNATSTATTTQITCVNTALDKRENALIVGHDAFAASIKTALQNRLTGLKAAWAETTKKAKQEKRNVTYKAFRTESQAAHTAMKTARLNAWRAFDTDMKACGVRGHGETPNTVSLPTVSL